MKLLVRNLAAATTEDKLVSLFSEHGKVQSCNLVLDEKTGKSKGFGFIEMPKVGEAKAAMQKLNGFKLAGNVIRVKKSQAKAEDVTPVTVEKKAPSVQFKQAKKPAVTSKPAATEKTTADDVIDNNDNAANLYGKIKESDDY